MKRTLWMECVALIVLGGLGLYGGLVSFMKSDARTQSSSLQPGVYVAAISLALVIVALVYGIASYRRARGAASRQGDAPVQDDAGAGRTVWLVYLGIVLYAVLIVVLGYVAATVAFLLAEFRILGERSWPRNIVLTLVVTALFYAVFVHYGEMIFPRGVFVD